MKEHNLTLILERFWLFRSNTENLVRLAKFLDCPLWENLEDGPRRHNLVNAIQRVEKCMLLGRPHPFQIIKPKDV